MALGFSIIAAAFTALCIWLGIRTYNRRERWAKWTLEAVIALPIIYAASLGPACWISSRAGFGAPAVSVIYEPLVSLILDDAPENPIMDFLGDILNDFSELFAADGWAWYGGMPLNGTTPDVDWEWALAWQF